MEERTQLLKVPQDAQGLALGLEGRRATLRVRFWYDKRGRELVELVKDAEGGPVLLYVGPLAYLSGLGKRVVCPGCGHSWPTMVDNPIKCPRCSRRLWQRPSGKPLGRPRLHPVQVKTGRKRRGKVAVTPTEEGQATWKA